MKKQLWHLLTGLTVVLVGVPQAQSATEVDTFSFASRWEITDPNGYSEIINLSGWATQNVYFEPLSTGGVGDAIDDNSDGLDEVTTELVALTLNGASSLFGTVSVTLNTSFVTLGQLIEQVNNVAGTLDIPPFRSTGTAKAFFDLFIDLSLDSLTLSNTSPFRVSGLTSYKPATPDEYGLIFGTFDPLSLSDQQGNTYLVTGRGVGNIPEPATLALFGLGLAGIGAVRRRRTA